MIYGSQGKLPIRRVIKTTDNELEIEKTFPKVQIYELLHQCTPDLVMKYTNQNLLQAVKHKQLKSISILSKIEDFKKFTLKYTTTLNPIRLWLFTNECTETTDTLNINFTFEQLSFIDTEQTLQTLLESSPISHILIEKRNDELTWPFEIISIKSQDFSRDQTLQPLSGVNRPIPGRIGIVNIGNSCFMSAGLQLLLHVRPLITYFSSDQFLSNIQTSILSKAFKEIVCNKTNQAHLSPVRIRAALSKTNMFSGSGYQLQQQDCQEFMSILLDSLELENKKLVSDLFYGKTQTVIKSEKEEKKLELESFSFLQVALPEDDTIRIDPVLVSQNGQMPVRYGKFTLKIEILLHQLHLSHYE